MKKARTNLFFVAALGILVLGGSAWAMTCSGLFQGLISYWNFDEGSGTTAYDWLSGNDGIIYGAQWTTGQVDGALSFNDDGDYVDCGNDTSLDITDNITISLWFCSKYWTTIHNDYDGLISKRENIYLGFDWEIYYDGNHREVRLWDGSVITFDNLHVNPSLNTWHHLAITKDGTTATLYLDGISQGTDTTSNSWDTGDSVRIGVIGLDRLDCGFNGFIDEVAIYDRALSAEEVLQLYEMGLSEHGFPVDLIIAFKNIEEAIAEKIEALERINAVLEKEWAAYQALEELLESDYYDDLNKGNIIAAKQKIHSAIQHQEQARDALEKSIEKLEDSLTLLGCEVEAQSWPEA